MTSPVLEALRRKKIKAEKIKNEVDLDFNSEKENEVPEELEEAKKIEEETLQNNISQEKTENKQNEGKKELEKEIKEVEELIERLNKMSLKDLIAEANLYELKVKENDNKILIEEDNHINEITQEELKYRLFEKIFDDAEYNKEILNILNPKELFNQKENEQTNYFQKYMKTIKEGNFKYKGIMSKKILEAKKKILKIEIPENEIVEDNKDLFFMATKIVDKKIEVLKEKEKTENKIDDIIKNVKGELTEEEKNKIAELENEKTKFDGELEKLKDGTNVFLKQEDFENKQLLKDKEKDKTFKEIVYKINEAKSIKEIKGINTEIKKLQKPKLTFNILMSLYDEVIENLNKAYEKATQIEIELSDKIQRTSYFDKMELQDLKRNFEEKEKNVENEKNFEKIEKKIKINDIIVDKKNEEKKGEKNETYQKAYKLKR